MPPPFEDEFLSVVDSTNRRAREKGLAGCDSGTGVFAHRQTAGRGRLQRRWHSPAGQNLYCSIVIRPKVKVADYPLLTMVAGLATARVIERYLPERVGLKWPNDIFIGGRKCGGILCESTADSSGKDGFVVVGIGLNCNMTAADIPPDLEKIATSIVLEGGPVQDIKGLFFAIRTSLLEAVAVFENRGFAEILGSWTRFDILAGKQTTWVASDGGVVSGYSLGPGTDGLLRIKDADGRLHTVVSGDLSLADTLHAQRTAE